MQLELDRAYAHALSVSLVSEGSVTLHYDLQMLPVATKTGIRWTVYAQEGAQSTVFKESEAATEVELETAKEAYCALLKDKKRKSEYREVTPEARKSKIEEQIQRSKVAVANTLPPWPGFNAFHVMATSFLGIHLFPQTLPSAYPAVVLADLAYGCEDGLPDAVALLLAPGTTAESLLARLSTEVLEWLLPYPALPAIRTLLLHKSRY
jgi:hypothetical protein